MTISLERTGSGPEIVFIHGFCEDRSMWSGMVQELKSHATCITLDLPGFGESALPDSEFTIQDIAKYVWKKLDEENINKPILIGHSLGGYVTLALLELYGEQISAACLFHSTSYADPDEKKLNRNKTIDFIKANGMDVFAPNFIPSLFYYKNRKQCETDIEAAIKVARNTPLETVVSYTLAMRDRPDRSAVLQTFPGRILLIAGDKDTAVPFQAVIEQAALSEGVTLEVLKGVGHMGMYEAKNHCLKLIKKFITTS